jgi:hypothetical protein
MNGRGLEARTICCWGEEGQQGHKEGGGRRRKEGGGRREREEGGGRVSIPIKASPTGFISIISKMVST